MRENMTRFIDNYGKVLAAGVSLVVIACASVIVFYKEPRNLEVSFLDVGQGDAILIESPSGKRVLIDGGPSNQILEKLSDELPFFARRIDLVIVTHPDADHITGLIPVLERFDIGAIMYSASGTTELFDDLYEHATSEGVLIRIARAGDAVDLRDGARIAILSPQAVSASIKDTNESSVSTLVQYGEHSFLLTGDLPMKREASLISDSRMSKGLIVYKAGHHGSKTSSGEALLSYIRPEYAVISAGEDNRYGHPHKEVIARLEKYSKEIISTMERGTITFISDGRLLEYRTEK